MRWSRFFIPTLKEIPAEAVVPSHRLMLRAGLIRQVAAAAARCGKTAAVCGEIAGDPVAIPVLAGLGVSSFSLNASGIPRVKETLRRLDAAAAAGWAEDLLRCGTAGEVRRRAAGYYDALPGGEAGSA
jgi:phosphotransferase system enzyme I (PtsI)